MSAARPGSIQSLRRAPKTPFSGCAGWISEREYPHVPTLEHARVSEITNVLVTFILVYECAVKMDLPELQSLVVQRLLQREQYFAFSLFYNVLQTLFTHTRADDSLRMKILGRCIENHEKVVSIPRVEVALHEHEFSAWEWGVAYFKAGCSDKWYKRWAEDKLDEAQDKLDSSQAARVGISGELEDMRKGRKGVAKSLSEARQHNLQLEQDLADARYTFEHLPMHCTCSPGLVHYKWLEERDDNGRMVYECMRCHEKWVLGKAQGPGDR